MAHTTLKQPAQASAPMTARSVLGNDPDAYFILERVYHDNGSHVSILVAQAGKKGLCRVEASLVEPVGFDSWVSTTSMRSKTFPESTSLDTLLETGKAFVPKLLRRLDER